MSAIRKEDVGLGLGTFLVGAVVGAVVGATLALLLAPESGDDSRKRLGHWLHDHHLTGHELMVKLKKMLSARHNGYGARHAVNGRTSAARRHRRI